MRRLLQSPRIKQRFAAAWQILPHDVQAVLKPFLRHVREVKTLRGAYIQCPDGTRYGPLEFATGFTFFYKQGSVAFSDVLLPQVLCDCTEAEAVGIILHELAHAYDYACYHERVGDTETLAELEAWDQAIAWAKASTLDASVFEALERAKFRETLRGLLMAGSSGAFQPPPTFPARERW